MSKSNPQPLRSLVFVLSWLMITGLSFGYVALAMWLGWWAVLIIVAIYAILDWMKYDLQAKGSPYVK